MLPPCPTLLRLTLVKAEAMAKAGIKPGEDDEDEDDEDANPESADDDGERNSDVTLPRLKTFVPENEDDDREEVEGNPEEAEDDDDDEEK